jgi:uncharacterized membrane protein YkvA (DUF1232 family)
VPSPFSLPLRVERFREQLSTEKLQDRLQRILADAGRAPSHGRTINGMKIGGMKLVRLLRSAQPARLATYLLALWKLFRHPATPLPAKLVAAAVLGYALSPIDLIPDFIPVLGQLDDLILIPLGVALAVKLTPRPLWEERLGEAQASADKLPTMLWGALLVLAIWAVLLGLLVAWMVSLLTP